MEEEVRKCTNLRMIHLCNSSEGNIGVLHFMLNTHFASHTSVISAHFCL